MNKSERAELLRIGREAEAPGLDAYLTGLVLDATMGEIVRRKEHAQTATEYFLTSLVFNAVFDLDIGCIDQIVGRIDGTAPSAEERDEYANLVGNAIDDVLQLPMSSQMQITPDDIALLAIAKAVVYLSTRPARSPQDRKDRQKAVELVFNRTSGRVSRPVKQAVAIEYVQPDWMQQLPEGGEDGGPREVAED